MTTIAELRECVIEQASKACVAAVEWTSRGWRVVVSNGPDQTFADARHACRAAIRALSKG